MSHRRAKLRVRRLWVWAVIAVWFLWPLAASAEPVRGSVLDGQTLEPIAGAELTIVGTDIKARTDQVGGFVFKNIGVGTVTVKIVAKGYEDTEEQLVIPSGGLSDATFVMLEPGLASEVIEISGSGPPMPEPPGKTELDRVELTRIPGSRGDALTSIKSLPGVANINPGGAGPGVAVIRGAAPEDSQVLIDGIQIPLLYHFFGLQSIVPSEFINAIDFLPGGFGAEEGRATGGVIRVATRAESVSEHSGFAEMSFINLAAFAQGPLSKKHNLQYAVGLRRSLIDIVLPAAIPDDSTVNFTTAPQYYDGQLRIDWRPDTRNRVTLLGLGSFDLLTLLNDTLDPNEPATLGSWENETSFLRAITTWQYTTSGVDNRLVMAPGVTGFRFEIGDRYLNVRQTIFQVRDDVILRPSKMVTLRTGGDLRFVRQDVDIRFPLAPQEGSGGPTNFSNAPLLELEEAFVNHTVSGYVAVDFRPVESLALTTGVRVDHFDRINQTTVSPRLSLQQKITDAFTLRAAVGTYSRQPDQGESLQATLSPELATQYVAGGEYAFAPGVKLTGSGFYTDRRQLVVQDPVAAAMDPGAAYANRGYGRSYGFEALLRVKRDNFFGWLSYTLSRSDRIDAPVANRRLFDFDQTHNFIAVGSYKLGNWEFGARWQLSSGNPITPVVNAIYVADFNYYLPFYGDINSDRLPTAHQLDVRIDRKWQFRTWSLSAFLDVTNVYANPRVLGVRYNFDFSERENVEELPVVPALGVRGSF